MLPLSGLWDFNVDLIVSIVGSDPTLPDHRQESWKRYLIRGFHDDVEVMPTITTNFPYDQ